MTLLGVPNEAQFSIGTSSTTAPTSSGSQVDMSLDDMIKNRRKTRSSTTAGTRRAAARKPTAADKAAGRQRATRTSKINARRGIQQSSTGGGKPSAMEVEREVYRQTRMRKQPSTKGAQQTRTRTRKDSAAQVKARKQQKSDKKKAQQKQGSTNPPTWIAATGRPPSKKAVNAAVSAMSSAGFKVPQGMQMVISFAPAPDKAPARKSGKGNQNKSQKGGNASNKGKQNKGKGGGRKK